MIINLGDAPFKAFIKVTYPSGTCTVSLGDKSFTHSGGGTHTFIVNKKGTWTVTATSTTGIVKTATANVTTYGQTVNVGELIYRQYLYNAGNEYSSITGGWGLAAAGATKNSNNIVLASGAYNLDIYAITKNNIDVSKYNKLCVYVSSHKIDSGAGNVWMKSGSTTLGQKQFSGSGAKTITLDISSISRGQVRVSANGKFGQGTACELTFTQVYLDV